MTVQTESRPAWPRRGDLCMRTVGVCFILPLILSSSILMAQPAQSGTPQHPVHKKAVKRHHHRRRTKASPLTQSVEVINGAQTQTTVFSAPPKTSVGNNASRGHGSTGTK